VQRSEDRPGGAANVCLDLAAMRGTVHAVGVTGDDRDADLLRSALAAAGMGAVRGDSLVTDASRPTTVKRSLIGLAQHRHPQKMFRVDHESRDPLSREVAGRLIAEVEGLLPEADVVCLEDYNKGVCTPEVCQAVIAAARRRHVPVLVDPANIDDYSRYRGASAITPNRTEAAGATGDRLPAEARPEDFAPIAHRLLTELALDAAVITLDKHGCLLQEAGAPGPIVVPTYARQVYDVTGAGDMVLAALAAGRANGMGWLDAVRFANAAAGLEVEVFGVVPMPIEKIHRECLLRERDLHPHAPAAHKHRTLDQLKVELSAARQDGKTIVFANGCFDVLHPGHVSLLQRAAALGGYLVVAINDDASVRRLKGEGRPVFPVADRVAMLSALACVDAVIEFSGDTAVPLIQALRPDILVKGDQYDIDKVPEAVAIRQLGGRVETLAVVDGKSTTSIVAKVRSAGGTARP
jgi:D-beta-D-heptose 7-phosphate kinase/D-beta-D-heptose 1-phosphate adenosyltransferase